ncbi:metalloregulator ArsR/SmtB family transcription factor [Bacillus sp. JJ664]
MIEKVIHAISEQNRRTILNLLKNEELTSSQIASNFDISPPAISQHLKVLENSGLVTVRKEGNKRIYQIRKEGFSDLTSYLDHFWDDSLSLLKQAAEELERRNNES